MEVHHSTHTPRAKWSHYAWEFFMLFLAVTAGFFMENQREHFVEHRREKDYIRQLVRDLENDTAFFTRAIEANMANHQRMDSLIYLLQTFKPGNPTDKLYYFARTITSKGISIEHSNRTFEQMKSSGMLRLVRKTEVLDSITLYYESFKDLEIRNQHRFERLSDLFRVTDELFDAWTMIRIADSGLVRLANTAPLLTLDPATINRYVTRLGYFKATDMIIVERTKQIFLPQAVKLIRQVKKAYGLK